MISLPCAERRVGMDKVSYNQIIIYHDETKDAPGRNFKGHVLFFVPVKLAVESFTPMFGSSCNKYSPQQMLFGKIAECRREFDCDGKLHFAEISGKTWKKYDEAYRKLLEVAADALRHKSQSYFPYPLNCKVAAIFYPKGADWNIYGGDSRKERILRHDETLLRILLKGASHYLYDDNNQVEVISIISDGKSAHRSLDEVRILWRLTHDDSYGRTPLRDYVSLSPDTSIIHLPSDHKQYQASTDEYIYANFLQVADLLLGSIMRASFVGINVRKTLPRVGDECEKKDRIAQPIMEMLDKKKRGAGFRHSGHYKSFTITQVNFSKDGINFQEVQAMEMPIQDSDALQMQFITIGGVA